MSAEREVEERSLAAGGAEPFPRQVEHTAAARSHVPGPEIPGSRVGPWRPGTGGGRALTLRAAAGCKGPLQRAAAAARSSALIFFERTGEMINHS